MKTKIIEVDKMEFDVRSIKLQLPDEFSCNKLTKWLIKTRQDTEKVIEQLLTVGYADLSKYVCEYDGTAQTISYVKSFPSNNIKGRPPYSNLKGRRPLGR